MKRTKKIAIIAAVVMTVCGLALSVGALAALDFDVSGLDTTTYVVNTYVIDESISDVSVNDAECDIRVLPAEDGVCKIVCKESDEMTYRIETEDGKLTIERLDHRRWYERIGVCWTDMEIVLYLPEGEYGGFQAQSVGGNIDIGDGLGFETVEIRSTSGNIAAEGATVQDSLILETVSGNVRLSGVRCGCLSLNTTSGETNLQNVVAEEELKIESVSGDIRLDACDGTSLRLKSGSGGVSGTLLTEKIFSVKTVSGEIEVPHSNFGGECEISTVSGDVSFTID